jgi:hypothetical protein
MVTEVHFINQGAKPGQSDSFQILLERKADMKQWRFLPQVFITYGEFIRHLGQAGDRQARESIIDKVLEGPFNPPFLQSKQSLTRAIIFAPPSGFPFPVEEIKQGDYLLYFNWVKEEKSVHLQTLDFRITRDEMDIIEEGKGLIVPIHR